MLNLLVNGYSQEQVDELILAVAWEVIKPENNQELSEMAVQTNWSRQCRR